MPSKTSKNTQKRSKPTVKEYEELGKAVAGFYESGYLDKRTTLKMSFLKGMAGGFGGVIGATIVVAILLGILSQFDQVPFVNKVINTIDSQNQYQKSMPSEQQPSDK